MRVSEWSPHDRPTVTSYMSGYCTLANFVEEAESEKFCDYDTFHREVARNCEDALAMQLYSALVQQRQNASTLVTDTLRQINLSPTPEQEGGAINAAERLQAIIAFNGNLAHTLDLASQTSTVLSHNLNEELARVNESLKHFNEPSSKRGFLDDTTGVEGVLANFDVDFKHTLGR